MNKTKIPRFTGSPEVWFHEEKNVLVVRGARYHCEVFRLDPKETSFWKMSFFKEQFSFDLYNGSKYLVEKGFELVHRLE